MPHQLILAKQNLLALGMKPRQEIHQRSDIADVRKTATRRLLNAPTALINATLPMPAN
jgi:hypothetical protein